MRKLLLLPLLLHLFVANHVHAQICSASNTLGCDTNSMGNLAGIAFYNINSNTPSAAFPGLSCSSGKGKPSANILLNSGKPVKIISGQNFYLNLNVTGSGSNVASVGVWLDLNQNDSFEASECLVKPGSNYLSPFDYGNSIYIVPGCFGKFGKSKMRIRTVPIYYASKLTASSGCGNLTATGSVYDVEIDLVQASKPSVGFNTSGPYCQKGNSVFKIDSANDYTNYYWSTFSLSSPSTGMGDKFSTRWTAVGKYDVQLISSNCGGKDSIIKQVKVILPSNVPNSDFFSYSNKAEIYYQLQFYSLADSGAYQYEWEFKLPSGNKYTSSVMNPEVMFDELGKWTVCFRARNDIGWSAWSCKFVWCVPPFENYLGIQRLAEQDSGILYDHAGPRMNYGNNRKTTLDYFKISPTGTTEIQLTFNTLKLADNNDNLRIYDGEDESGILLTPSGGINASNQNAFRNKMLKAYSGAVYITFESNNSGSDSGFAIHWKAIGAYQINGILYLDKDSDCVYNDKKDISVPESKMKIGSTNVSMRLKNGVYSIITDSSAKVFYPILPNGWLIKCPAAGKDTWNTNKSSYINFGIRPDPSNPVLDIRTKLNNYQGFTAKRGVQNTMELYLDNIGNMALDSGIFKLKYSRKLKNLKLTSGSFSSTDSSIEFKTSGLDCFGNFMNEIIYTPYSTDTGYLEFEASFNALAPGKKEIDTVNNKYKVKLKIINAHDPNDKQVSEPERMDDGNKKLTYFVRFQNTGTAPATDVIVRDTLSPLLDTNSIEFLNSSHIGFMERKGYALSFNFLNINLIDSNHNEKESHGYFYYSINTKKFLQPYENINNTAHIYFDAESPVVTNTTMNYWVSPPLVTANGGDPHTITVCDTFYDPGATALDLIDGNLNKSVMRIGNYTNHVAGKYPLKYFAVNSHGDTGWASRLLIIVDEDKPHIRGRVGNIKDQMQVLVQIDVPFIDSVYAYDSCLGRIPCVKKPGINGPVNGFIKGVYPITYFAKDSAGNRAYEDSFTINYRVDDYISPTILINAPDTNCHQIFTPFTPDSAVVTDNYYSRSQISLVVKHQVNPNIAGDYLVIYEATDGSGNLASKGYVVRVADCKGLAGVLPILQGTERRIYPNPASDQIVISGIPAQYAFGNVQILDVTGKCIFDKCIPTKSEIFMIEIANFPDGFYIIKTQFDSDLSISKMSIQH